MVADGVKEACRQQQACIGDGWPAGLAIYWPRHHRLPGTSSAAGRAAVRGGRPAHHGVLVVGPELPLRLLPSLLEKHEPASSRSHNGGSGRGARKRPSASAAGWRRLTRWNTCKVVSKSVASLASAPAPLDVFPAERLHGDVAQSRPLTLETLINYLKQVLKRGCPSGGAGGFSAIARGADWAETSSKTAGTMLAAPRCSRQKGFVAEATNDSCCMPSAQRGSGGLAAQARRLGTHHFK